MERRHDADTQKTRTSEVAVDEQKANPARRGNRPAARVVDQATVKELAQVQHALKAVHRSAEARTEKIEALRARIEAGTYQVDSASLAMKLLGITEQDAG